MKILQINTTVNTGSTGRITEDIGKVFISGGHESFIAFGRGDRPSQSVKIKVGTRLDIIKHGIKTIFLDQHGFGSKDATQKLVNEIDSITPDIIGLHNLHGYYLNIEVLFKYISYKNIPVVWTLFDCWSFTGHCSYFDDINCERWISGCFSCPKKNSYPGSYVVDNSLDNYKRKKEIFNSIPNLSIVVHSNWLAGMVRKSFLGGFPVTVIRSGIDLSVFKPVISDIREKNNINKQNVILGCANIWDKRKGLFDFIKLSEMLDTNQVIVLVGLTKKQISMLPAGIIGIGRTENIQELASLYSTADVFVNPTWQDNFPTTNLEALACGTPVITYRTGGSPEAVSAETGFVVDKGDIYGIRDAIKKIEINGRSFYKNSCRKRAEELFNKDDRFQEYLHLYENLLNRNEFE